MPLERHVHPARAGRPLEVPSGTHGLTDINNVSIGKIVSVVVPEAPDDGRDHWIWKSGQSFPTVFKLTGFVVPASGARTTEIFEYPDEVFKGTPSAHTIPDPSASVVYKIETGAGPTLIGYLDLGASNNLGGTMTWYIANPNSRSMRVPLERNETLTFTKLSSAVGSYTCYKLAFNRVPAM